VVRRDPGTPGRWVAAGAVLAAAAVAGCGATGSASPPPAPPPALPASAVPYLPSRARALPAATLAREAALPPLSGRLRAWGYVNGTARSFQGQSRRRLQVVDSRTLQFRSPAGARAFVAYVRAHAPSFLGGAAEPRAYVSRGRRGLVVSARPCACHLANPALLAVVGGGARVTWLEINGPGATRAELRRLAARAP
jgi:hypothetical protein